MKHTLRFDLNDPVDKAELDLATNGMYVMGCVTYMSGGLSLALEDLKKKKITEAQFVKEIKSLATKMDKELKPAYKAFWYVQNTLNSFVCEDCQQETEKENKE